MAQESTITTQYTPDQPRVLSANYRMDRADRIFLDEQVLGAHRHLCDSLIRGQIGSNFVLSGSSAALAPGDLFCAAGETSLEEPSRLAVRKVTKATSLALAAAGVVLGVAVASAQPGTWVRGALEGIVGNYVTGLATGAAGPVRASSAGRAERVVSLSSGDYPVGYVDGYGNLSLARERAVGAGGGGGGGYTTVLDDGSPVTQRSTLNFTGAGVTVADVGGVTQVAITSTPPPTGSAVGQTQLWDGSAWQAGALDLADADARTGTLPAGNGGTGIAGAGGTANRVLVTTNGSTWAAGLVALSTMISGTLPFGNLADGAATSVLGRAADSVGVQASIAATADGQVLRRAAGVLGFGALDLADGDAITGLLPLANLTGGAAVGQVLRNTTGNVPAWGALDLSDGDAVTGLLPHANIADGPATSVLGRAGGTSGVLAPIAASADGQFLQRVGGALAWATVNLSSLTGGTAVGQVLRNAAGNVPEWGAVDLADPDAVTGLLPHGNVASLAALSVFGRSANTTGVMAAITGTNGQALRVSGTTLGFGTLATAAYTDASVTLAKIANGTASSVLGRSAATGGVYADIVSSADGQVLRRGASGVIGWGAVDLADSDAATGLLPHANIANGAAASVFGRSQSSAGVMASISALTDGQVLRRAGGVIEFGALDLADPDAVGGLLPHANLANLAGLSVLGRSANTSGGIGAITGADGQVLRVSGTTLGFGTLATAGIGDGTVTPAKLANLAGLSILGRATSTTGVPAAITATAAGQVLRRIGNVIEFGALDLSDLDAVTGLLPVTNLAPSGTNGRVFVTTGGVAAWGFDLGNNTDAFTYNGASHTFSVAGSAKLLLTSTEMRTENNVSLWRFDDSAVGPSIGQHSDATVGVTGDRLLIQAQSVGGTGATVGGALTLKGGDSAFGTGGTLNLHTGEGASADGAFNVYTGGNLRMSIPGTGNVYFQDNSLFTSGNVILGTDPASTGTIRLAYGATITGRVEADTADRIGVKWGAGASADTWTFGDSTAFTEIQGHSIGLFGATGGFGGGSKVVSFGASSTTPTTGATGATLVYSNLGTLEARVEQGGVWQMAAGTRWHRRYEEPSSVLTTNGTSATDIAFTAGGLLPTNCTGEVKVFVSVFQVSTGLPLSTLVVATRFKKTGSTLTVIEQATDSDPDSLTGLLTVPTGTNVTVRITPSSSEARKYRVLFRLTFAITF